MAGEQATFHPAIEALIERVSAQVRWRRAEHGALRGAFWGTLGAAGVLLLRVPLGARALAGAAACVLLGVVVGGVLGLARRVAPVEAARLADRAFGLKDRVATALEWASRADRPRLVDALVADAAARVVVLEPRQVVRRVVPREARWLPVPLAVAVALAVAPPMPLPRGFLPDFSAVTGREEGRERTDELLTEQERRAPAADGLRRPVFEERDLIPRGAAAAAATSGDLAAVFKDTALATRRPDFNSFLKKGDERLRMLAQADQLPDLQSDFTASQHKIIFRKSKELRGGLRPDQLSPQKLRELLEEMERLGRKGSPWGSDVAEGMEALDEGQPDRALAAMEKALDKLRAAEEAQRSGKGLKGGRDRDGAGGTGRERGRSGNGQGGDDRDFSDGEGLMPGKGKSGSPKGEPSQRLRASPYDAGVEGESRQGRKQGYDTNMTGRPGQMASRLAYLGVIGQYRKLMEDEITREQVPREYHTQIKDYFQALDER